MFYMKYSRLSVALGILLPIMAAQAQVVINEIFCGVPNDMPDLQWVELANTTGQAVNLGGWSLAKGVKFKFSDNAAIQPQGHLVVCRNREAFRKYYTAPVAGEFDKPLKKSGEQLELRDAGGKTIDSILYEDKAPWPIRLDGSSLERICPTASGKLPENWAPSPLAGDAAKPGGTPGQPNSSYAAVLPPVIRGLIYSPTNAQPDQAIRVEAEVKDAAGVRDVTLLYRVIHSGSEGEEKALPMTETTGQRYAASIPGQAAGQIVRFRVRASNRESAQRLLPGENEARPAISCLVWTNNAPSAAPQGYIIHTDARQGGQRRSPGRGGPGNEEDMARFMAEMQFQQGLDLPGLWASLTLTNATPVESLRPVFDRKLAERDELQKKTLKASNIQEAAETIPRIVKAFKNNMGDALKPSLNAEQTKAFEAWRDQAPGEGGPFNPNPETILRQILPFEAAYLHLATRTNVPPDQFNTLRDIYREAIGQRNELAPDIRAAMSNNEGQRDQLMTKIQDMQGALEKKLEAALSPEQSREWNSWRAENQRGFMGPGRRQPPAPALGKSAFVYVDPQSRQPQLFDFVNIPERSGGWKVHFGQGQSLKGMTGINLIFEMSDRWLLSEPLAYELHRRAGLAASKTDYVRLWLNGEPLGYHLLIEQPNKAYLRRNGLRDDGNLYKATYMGDGVVGQHEKKTHLETGHDDLVELVKRLEKSKAKPDEQWNLIKQEFDVEEVVSHYAVRALIADWDGYFNNYYLYHDLKGSKKWTFYPWDEDKTWGEYDGWEGSGPLYNMPLTFGAEGDKPPGWKGSQPPSGFMGPMGDASWWRPGGWISKPLLANPTFRKHFLARIKDLLQSEFTEARLFPLMEQYRDRLKEEVRFRAQIQHGDPAAAEHQLEANIASLKDFATRRREWLLSQEEIKTAGVYEPKKLQ
jgi:hypothetical protein